jgi:hypothetical protein
MLINITNWLFETLGKKKREWVGIGEYGDKTAAEAFLLACYKKGFWVQMREVRGSFDAITGFSAAPTLWIIDLRMEETERFEHALRSELFLPLENHWVKNLPLTQAQEALEFPLHPDAEIRHLIFHRLRLNSHFMDAVP